MTTHYHLKFAKLLRGTTSQFTSKRARMQMSRFYQYRNNTIILFVTQYKNDNTAFHRSSAVSGGLALLRAFCQWQWKIEHQVRNCCVKGLILRKKAGSKTDAGRLYESGYKQ